MTRITRLFAAVGGLFLCGAAAPPSDPTTFVRIQPGEVHWTEEPGSMGVQSAVLAGDPNKPGVYVMRVRFPPHVMDRPHRHPNARYVTVLQGTWYAGTGPTFDLAKAVPMPAGSFMVHPAQGPHWDGSAGDEPVIVQITGFGPGSTTLVDPAKSMWIDVSKMSK